MSVWYVIPSKRPPEQVEPVLRQWRERGYYVAIQRDIGEALPNEWLNAQIARPYLGYAESVNHLVRGVMEWDSSAEWIVTGGDDVLPDPNHSAEEIARQCSDRFFNLNVNRNYARMTDPAGLGNNGKQATFGVMQPTGDREFGDAQGPYIDRVAGSPWLGREFCRRMYGGRGPLCEEYYHMGEDEELQAVATKLGVFWQRPDLVHRHEHWGRPRAGEKMGLASRMPEFLQRANSPEEWQKFKRIFAARKASGFPGHEPIP